MTATPLPPHLRRYTASGLWANKTIGDYAVQRAAERPNATAFIDGAYVLDRQTVATQALALADALTRTCLHAGYPTASMPLAR